MVLRPNMRGIPESMVCRILVFMWSFGTLTMPEFVAVLALIAKVDHGFIIGLARTPLNRVLNALAAILEKIMTFESTIVCPLCKPHYIYFRMAVRANP